MKKTTNEDMIKEKYVSKIKIKARKIKLIDRLKDEKYQSEAAQHMIMFGIALLDDLLEGKENGKN